MNQGTNHNTLSDTINWFKQAVPIVTENTLQVQMGVHFEEVTEMLDTIEAQDPQGAMLMLEAREALKQLANDMKRRPMSYRVLPEDRAEMLDSLADQLVTAAGTAYMLDMDIDGALDEVNRSNYSKFVDGKAVFTEHGKIAKGPDYTKPDLTPFL